MVIRIQALGMSDSMITTLRQWVEQTNAAAAQRRRWLEYWIIAALLAIAMLGFASAFAGDRTHVGDFASPDLSRIHG